jgi:hypothetical protein
MADGLHDARDRQAAEQEAAEIGRAHQPDRRWREAFLRAAQRDQRALQPVAAEQDAGGDQQGDEGTDRGHGPHVREESGDGDHAAISRRALVPIGPVRL